MTDGKQSIDVDAFFAQSDPFADVPPDHRSGFVAVVGRPNVGKSTLMNAILGQKVAIVSPRPQTTRNRIAGILTREDCQIVFIDTPGIHKPKHKLGEFMMDQARKALPDADLALWVVDVSKPPRRDDERVAAVLQAQPLPVILAMNKIDITPPDRLLAHAEAYRALVPGIVEDIAVSALKHQGVDALVDRIREHLPPGPRYYPPGQVSDIQERFLVAELIREKALLYLQEEVPHAVAVDLQDFEERENGVIYIFARIFVERESQKGILIGKRGAMIKKIGQEARKEIEAALGRKVYLELRVKVKPKWRRNPAELRRLGYA
ncbi:MAG TPA: GTPase Era [Anaerolineae bacterium]|nr:GTPase Era [Anaerolineae bacterium]